MRWLVSAIRAFFVRPPAGMHTVAVGAGRSFRAGIYIDHGPGRRRFAGPAFGRLVIADDKIIVRSVVLRWIPERSDGKADIGEIAVVDRIELHLPVPYWRRKVLVSFKNPGSALFGVALKLPRTTQAIDELRARGFSVTGGQQM